MTEESAKPPKVFISYAWEDDVKIWVRAFAKQLRKDGVETVLDQWETHYGDQLPEFMEKAVRESDFAILVCTPKYKKKTDEREGGVGYEGHIITSEIFQKSNHRKFIPVLRKGNWGSALPSWAAGKLSIDLSGDPYSQKNYRELLRVLHDKWYTPPPVGRPPDFPDEEDDNNLKKPKLPQFNIDPKIAFRFFLGIIAVLMVVFGVPRFASYVSQIKFPTPFPTSTFVPTLMFTPANTDTLTLLSPTLTLTPTLPTETNTPVFTQTFTFTTTPLPDEFIDGKGLKMRLVSAGIFKMGSNSYDFGDNYPMHEVYLDAYYMDIYEVTNAAYKLCVEAGKCDPPKRSSSNRHLAYYDNFEFRDYPIIYVDWYMAKNYCEWRDAHLPTEAEWEKAARGTDGRTYPWGEGIGCNQANVGGCNHRDVIKVGNYESGKSPYGVYDMVGNVEEWVSSLFKPYPYDANDGRENSSSSGSRVLRGGTVDESLLYYYTSSADRDDRTRDFFDGYTGFRCARSP